ncbi:hypothetical protein GQ55_1G378900 [Panicum hallii var. hallii]|uniref:Uncharacterized protein n=1 Tax=Panicum hallii var. hallii TaxID=1504633 RepID=A0A2T7FBS3_9POAL|nr:hypothetical protein GQ55_1G378900 [Panicum hallii var. hallii]
MRKVVVATLLVLVVTSASATHAAPRALPGAKHASSAGISTYNVDDVYLPSPPPPTRSSSSHWRGLRRLLLSLEESAAGHSCGSNSKNIHCP